MIRSIKNNVEKTNMSSMYEILQKKGRVKTQEPKMELQKEHPDG